MSKDPAVLFYTSDFISGTMLMSDEQRGKYIILLCLQHQQGGLTYDDMINICKTYDKKIWGKFVKLEDELYYNERMKRESERRKAYSESRRRNRKTSKTHDSTYVPHMETGTETKDKRETYIIQFEKLKFDLPEGYEDIILLWLKYKSEKGQSYKDTGLKTLINKLIKNYKTESGLKQDIEYSMSNNYSGIFKDRDNGTTKTDNKSVNEGWTKGQKTGLSSF